LYQYLPGFSRLGWRLEVVPLFDDDYLEDLYTQGRRRFGRIVHAYARRLASVARVGAYDLVWLEKECWPWVPAAMDVGSLGGARLVVDYDDAVFHLYDTHRSALVRRMLGTKIDALMRRATLVVAGNSYLAERANRAGARRVEIIPSVVDLDRYPKLATSPNQVFTVGWIGSPATQHFLAPVATALARALAPVGGKFVTIGGRFPRPLFARHDALDWQEATELDALQQLDVGIMPLTDTPFERGKCGFKLIQYMACGVATVASPVGVNRELASGGNCGLLADAPEEWERAIGMLRDDTCRRVERGWAGRCLVEQRYGLEVTQPLMERLLSEAADRSIARELTR